MKKILIILFISLISGPTLQAQISGLSSSSSFNIRPVPEITGMSKPASLRIPLSAIPKDVSPSKTPTVPASSDMSKSNTPTIKWLDHPPVFINQDRYTLKAQIQSKAPIFKYNVFHNSQLISCPSGNGNQLLNCEITLKEGKNTFYIEAYNQTGMAQSTKLETEYAPPSHRKNYALIFAVENYDNSYTWQQLPNAIKGAEKLKTELESTFNFAVELFRNPTFSQMESALNQYLQRSYQPEDQLLIVFTGHGDIQKRGNTNIGYLVAKDAKTENRQRINFFRHDDFGLYANDIPCRHVMVVLDACFSSTFGMDINAAITGADPKGSYLNPSIAFDQQIRKYLQKKSRLYLSSGESKTLGGTQSKASPFFEQFLTSLQSSVNKSDNMVSFDEIKLDLMRGNLNPAPKGGRFGNHEAEGNFLFVVKEN